MGLSLRVGVALSMMGVALLLAVRPSAAEEDGDWPMPGKNFAGFRYSSLDQINADNVGRLGVAWTFSLGVLRGQEAAPIVADDTMFVVTPYPNIVYALDLTRPGAPLKWKHEPKPVAASQGIACCDTVNRGAVYAGGKVFYNTLDGQTIALDARDGREIWSSSSPVSGSMTEIVTPKTLAMYSASVESNAKPFEPPLSGAPSTRILVSQP
jgi:lanthanide-dependent methanol dehydrogenase